MCTYYITLIYDDYRVVWTFLFSDVLRTSRKSQRRVLVDWSPCYRVVMVIIPNNIIDMKSPVHKSQVLVFYCCYFFLFLEAVVAESVVVIKKLLQNQPEAHCDIIRHMARLMDSIAVPQARASILWLLGEYSQLVSTIAPDVLRKVAKTYVTEVTFVLLKGFNNVMCI